MDDAQHLRDLLNLADPARGLKPEQAEQAAREAQALAKQSGCAPEAAQAGVWLARHLYHLGRHLAALAQAQDILERGPERIDLACRADALRVAALSACELGRFDVAFDTAQSLVQLAASGGDSATSLSAALALAVCFERLGDMWQAERLLSRALQDHGAQGPDGAVLSVSNALCAVCAQVARLLHDSDAAEERSAVLERGRAAGARALVIAERMGNPAYLVALQANLAEILIDRGEHDEAVRLLEHALAASKHQGLSTYTHYIRMLHADATLRLGLADPAYRLAIELLAEFGDETAAATVARVHEVAGRAGKATGRYKRALEHLDAAQRIERRLLTTQMRMQSELLVSRGEELRARLDAERAQSEAREQHARAARLQVEAERDALTGIGNRRLLERRAAELLSEHEHGRRPLALALLDIDHFKKVNDHHGHAAGDAVLVALAGLMGRCVREGDVLVRHGGEEFVILLPGASVAQAHDVCERLRAEVERQALALPDGGSLAVTVSIGLATAPPYSLQDLLRRADEALYEAKRTGRNRLCMAALAS